MYLGTCPVLCASQGTHIEKKKKKKETNGFLSVGVFFTCASCIILGYAVYHLKSLCFMRLSEDSS